MAKAFQADAFQTTAFQSADAPQGYGQAQATILQDKVFGQAQADIKQIYQGYGQAQGQLTQVGLVQSKTASAAGLSAGIPWSITLDSAPTAGNLIVVVGSKRSWHGPDLGLSVPWVQVAFVDQNDGIAMSYRIVPSGMSATISGNFVGGNNNNDWSIGVFEFDGDWRGSNFVAFDTFDSAGASGTTTPLGPVTPKLPYAGVGVVVADTQTFTTYTNNNSYIEILDGLGGQVNAPSNNFAYKIIPNLGTSQSVTLTNDQGINVTSRIGILAIFSESNYTHRWGQAQARIFGFPTQSAQAQAVIKQTYQQYAQANAWISEGIRIVQQTIDFWDGANPITPSLSSTTAGNILIAIEFVRGNVTVTPPGSPAWTTIESKADSGSGLSSPNAGSMQAWYRYTSGGETSLGTWTRDAGVDIQLAIYEITPATLYDSELRSNQLATAHPTLAVTSPTGKPVIMFGVFMATENGPSFTYSPDADYVEDLDAVSSLGTRGTIIHRIADISSGSSYTLGTTISVGTSPWGAIVFLFSIVRNYGSGQAQATISATSTKNSSGQANAQISKSAGYGQANADIKQIYQQYAQAQADIYVPFPTYRQFAQAQADIAYKRWGHGQARALIRVTFAYGLALSSITNALARAHGQARAAISSGTKQKFGQAQAKIVTTQGYGQAQAYILSFWKFGQALGRIKTQFNIKLAQAQADVKAVTNNFGQAQAYIAKTCRSGQAQGYIKTTERGYGQALGFVGHFGVGQVQAYISTVSYLVKFNGYILPGYAQSESFTTETGIDAGSAIEIESFTEYTGLKNKLISLTMKVNEPTYAANKLKVMLAGSMLRSNTTWAKLYIQDSDSYYLAMTNKIDMDQEAQERAIDYNIEWVAKPWRYSDATYTTSGIGLVEIARDLSDGGWTPAQIFVDGTDITLSGYTATGDFAGYVTISGAVTNYEVFTENRDYGIFLGPGTTYIETDGATDCQIIWQNRWFL